MSKRNTETCDAAMAATITAPDETPQIDAQTNGDTSMTKNTTELPVPATITEKELFAEFMESSFVEYDRLGRRLESRHVADLLETEGIYDYVEVDLQMNGYDDDPSYQLEMIEENLSDILEGVRLAITAFDKFKDERKVPLPEAPDEADTEAYEAWEDACDEAEENPCYLPAAANVSQEVV